MRYLTTDDGCWLWQGDVTDQGYGRLMIDSRLLYAHRVSYQLHVGAIPRGRQIDHICHTPACPGGRGCPHRRCVNPAHLEVVTSLENSMRGNHPLYTVARQLVCQRGHDLNDPENVYVRPNGKRRCKVCQIEGQRKRRANR